MKILYHNPPCEGGIEQAGYIFLLLLKKLGHYIDFWNTQCARIQEEVISKEIRNYDYVVLNSPHRWSLGRIVKDYHENLFGIFHAIDESIRGSVPPFCKILSLNYLYQYEFLYKAHLPNLIFPLTYPFWWERDIPKVGKKRRKYFFIFVGRWIPTKFHPYIRNFFEKNNIMIDLGVFYSIDKGYRYSIFRQIKKNQSIKQIYFFLRNAAYILLPSITECISFVIGEAVVNGCFPIIYETEENIHRQYFVGYKFYSLEDFAKASYEIFKERRMPPFEFYEKFVPFSRKMWSIEKTLEEMKLIFGKGKKGRINVKYSDVRIKKRLWYKNASIITQEKI